MIDFHTHILPGIDDGSKSVGESLEMLVAQSRQEVEETLLTPHFYAGKDSVQAFLQAREDAKRRLQKEIAEREIQVPHLRCGAEVYYFPGMGKAEMVSALCIEDSHVLLLELPFCQWEQEVFADVVALVYEQKLEVIVAHIERYYPFQKNKKIWNKIFDLPIYSQINAGSFLHWRRRKRVLDFLREDYRVVLGSDCHDTQRRPPNLQEARSIIARKAGTGYLERMDAMGERILAE